MNHRAKPDAYGTLIEPATLKIERLLPGPIERVFAFLVESDLRRQWLAAGDMEPKAGAAFELVWRNDELTDPPGRRPEGFAAEHRMRSRILEIDPPRKLAFTWGDQGGSVTFTLAPQDGEVLLTVVHRRIADRENTLKIGAGWHSHLDILVARLSGAAPQPFWDRWLGLRREYEGRVPV